MASSSSSSSSSKNVTLIDLPSREPCRCWSFNPWKARLYLNYKKIPYTTKWVNYPDIPATISQHVAPHPDGTAMKPYTIPAVILPDGTYVQDSMTIVEKLDKLYPEPELKIRTPLLTEVMELISKIVPAASPEFMARLPERVLDAKDTAYWNPDREKMVGMPVKEFQDSRGGKQTTENVAEHVRAVGELLEKKGGPFFEGEQVTYVDFMWASFLLFLERIGSDAFDIVIVEERQAHVRLLEEVKRRGWSKRDNH